MPVRPYSHEPKARATVAAFCRKPTGIVCKAPTEGSRTQKRKRNKHTHMTTTAQFR